MSINFRMLVFWTTVVLCISQSTAWWWGSSNAKTGGQEPQWPMPMPMFYQQRLLQAGPPYHQGNEQPAPPPMALPAIPIQVPLQAQLAPAPNIHNVQLVPCLCPVSQEDYEKPIEFGKKDV